MSTEWSKQFCETSLKWVNSTVMACCMAIVIRYQAQGPTKTTLGVRPQTWWGLPTSWRVAPAVPSWSPAILYRGQWSVCNFKSGANTIRGRINYSSTHDRRRYFSVGSQFCCTYQNWRLYIVAALHWILNILWFLWILIEFFYWYDSGFLKSLAKIINFDNT